MGQQSTLEDRSVLIQFNQEVEIPEGLGIEEVRPGDNALISIVTKRDGDYRISYDNTDPIQVANVRALFERLVERGMEPHMITKAAKEGDPHTKSLMKGFDEKADDILFMPRRQMAGG